MRAISSHRSSKRSRGKKIMFGLTRMPALARRSSGKSIQLVWPWTSRVSSTLSSG
jgi:hypothetical protein